MFFIFHHQFSCRLECCLCSVPGVNLCSDEHIGLIFGDHIHGVGKTRSIESVGRIEDEGGLEDDLIAKQVRDYSSKFDRRISPWEQRTEETRWSWPKWDFLGHFWKKKIVPGSRCFKLNWAFLCLNCRFRFVLWFRPGTESKLSKFHMAYLAIPGEPRIKTIESVECGLCCSQFPRWTRILGS